MVAFLGAVGGFLFGYDTGIISGVMLFVRDEFDLNEWWQESIVSSTLLAAWVFSMISGSVTDGFGRRPVIIMSSLIFVIGSIMMALALNEYLLLCGRLVVGAGVGFASMTVPMYIAEVAPSNIRGQLVMINMCFVTGGQFFASLIAYGFSLLKGNEGWRWMLGFAAIPASIQFVAFLFMPESPRWLIRTKQYEKAIKVLRRIRPYDSDIKSEFDSIKDNCLKAAEEQELIEPGTSTFQRILETPPVRKALILGCMLQLIQQVSGINTVMYYTASIIEMSGVYSKPHALLLSSGTAFVNFVFTIVGYMLVERAGRRKLTLFSLFGVILSLFILGAGFQFSDYYSPPVTIADHQEANKMCSSYTACSGCSRNIDCGYCFTYNGSEIVSSCLAVDGSHHDRSLIGDCIKGTSDSGSHIWAYEWCPSNYSWVTMLGLVLYLFFFAPGMGPMPWTINSEIYPSWARSWCFSASTSVNWLFNLLISMTFLSLTRLITKQGTFYLYAAMANVGFIYFFLVLPETRGKTLEELETLFDE
ncbi:Proton myo-inositol cotransporter [Fragariocoptes setiger]|uniref:Proton myo-inositol cotransporter n=1 Tax=Fragariocoptes setiger TaxID=1670756 RepID=A0ABQ7S993_9ACAR|nr:Proton myo-inositol cotransporter [Fragariocoptes setiger]